MWRPLPKYLEARLDREIQGYNDAVKKIAPRCTDKYYLEGYEAKMKGYSLSQQALQYIMR